MKRLAVALLARCAAAPADVPPLGDYTTWKRIDTYGETAGHGDTYRIIYANVVATTYDASACRPPDRSCPPYPGGTTLVKEIYVNAGGSPGALETIEIARRMGAPTDAQHGWVFTAASSPAGSESIKTTCWRRCHQASPFDGAWFDYSK